MSSRLRGCPVGGAGDRVQCSAALSLTLSGRRAAGRVSAARAEVLEGALSVLSPAERSAFEALAGKILVGLMGERGAVRWTCRMCDTRACGRDSGACPVAAAACVR